MEITGRFQALLHELFGNWWEFTLIEIQIPSRMLSFLWLCRAVVWTGCQFRIRSLNSIFMFRFLPIIDEQTTKIMDIISSHPAARLSNWLHYCFFIFPLRQIQAHTWLNARKTSPKRVFRRNPFIYLRNQFSMKSNNNAREKPSENIWTGTDTTDVYITLFALPSIDGANEKVSHFKQEYLPISPIWK